MLLRGLVSVWARIAEKDLAVLVANSGRKL